jgi:hypothetical protein
MRRLLFILLTPLLLTTTPTRAQSTSDLIQQLLLDVQKLDQLKAILQDMYKGYEIVNQGYTDIKNIASGNFNLHKLFLDGLLAVSPAVRNYTRVAEILDAEATIVAEYKTAMARLHSNSLFTPWELDYIGDTYSALFRRSLQSIDELTMVITAGELRMSDAQRLRSIDRVYADISSQLQFLRKFNNSTSLQSMQRAKEYDDINTLKRLYGNPH